MQATGWKCIVVAEAATCFRRNSRKTVEAKTLTLAGAKTWVQAQVASLLEDEEQISQALVVQGDRSFELCPSSWGAQEPLWRQT